MMVAWQQMKEQSKINTADFQEEIQPKTSVTLLLMKPKTSVTL